MAAKLRLLSAVCALIAAVVVVWQTNPLGAPGAGPVRPAIHVSAHEQRLHLDQVAGHRDGRPTSVRRVRGHPARRHPAASGLVFTPPEHEDGLRCHYDAGNYQMAVEAFVWRTYEQTLPADAVELDIDGHRAAQYWIMKPTDWNNRWWITCMIAFKTSYGVLQQSLFYSPIYSADNVDCLSDQPAAGAANWCRTTSSSPHELIRRDRAFEHAVSTARRPTCSAPRPAAARGRSSSPSGPADRPESRSGSVMSCVESTVSPSIRTVPSAVSSTTETSSPSGCSRRSHGASTHAGRDQVTVAGEDVALVERRLPVGPRRVGDVAERAAAGEQRRLPAVPPEALELADALAADAQPAAGERVLRRRRPAATPAPGTAVRSAARPSGRRRGTS